MRLVPFTGRVRNRSGAEEPASLRSELDRMMDRYMRSPLSLAEEPFGQMTNWAPSVDISESQDELVVRAEVPGMDPSDIDITISGDRLIISGEKQEQREEQDEHFYHCERRFGAFERSIELPSTANSEKVSADHSNGVLTIHVPKHETAKPKRVQIESKSGDKRKQVSVSESSQESDARHRD